MIDQSLERTTNTQQLTNPALGPKLQEWLAGTDPGLTFAKNFVPNLITLLLIGGAAIFFFMLLFGAIEWILSGGDKGRVESARGRLTNALLGLFIMFALFAIVRIVERFFGTDILSLDIDILKIQ